MRLSCKRLALIVLLAGSFSGYYVAAQADPDHDVPSYYLAGRPPLPIADGVAKEGDQTDSAQVDSSKSKLPSGKNDKCEKEPGGEDSKSLKGAHGYERSLNLVPLNLTAKQKDTIQAMRKKSGKRARDLRASLKAKRSEMRDLMFDPNSTNRQILKVRNEARQLHEQADDLMMQDFLAIRDLLTAEQKKHLPEIKPADKERGKAPFSKAN